MNLSTGLTLTQSLIANTPSTQFAKNAVEAVAIKQGHTCLKFTNKKGIGLGNSDWITGVDCNNLCENQINKESDGNNNSTDDKCTPELEQCKSEDDSSDNNTCTDEDIKEEMDDIFDNDDNNDNEDTSNKDADDEHNDNDDDDDDENGDNGCTAPPQNEADTMEEKEETMAIQPKLHQQSEIENAKKKEDVIKNWEKQLVTCRMI